jgi:hypothetical protein
MRERLWAFPQSTARDVISFLDLAKGPSRLPLSVSTTLESEANLTGENGATGFGSSLPVLGF